MTNTEHDFRHDFRLFRQVKELELLNQYNEIITHTYSLLFPYISSIPITKYHTNKHKVRETGTCYRTYG